MAEQQTGNVISIISRQPVTTTNHMPVNRSTEWNAEAALKEAIRLCQEEGFTKATILLHRMEGVPHKLSVGVTYTEEIANLEFWKQSLLAEYEG